MFIFCQLVSLSGPADFFCNVGNLSRCVSGTPGVCSGKYATLFLPRHSGMFCNSVSL
jgi:hypothetical protein